MNRIKELRIMKNWTQDDLASKLNTKRQSVGHYETGRRDLDTETVCRLCDIFGCSADFLLGRSSVPSYELSKEEEQLLIAWRRSDQRARDVISIALAPFYEENIGQRAI